MELYTLRGVDIYPIFTLTPMKLSFLLCEEKSVVFAKYWRGERPLGWPCCR